MHQLTPKRKVARWNRAGGTIFQRKLAPRLHSNPICPAIFLAVCGTSREYVPEGKPQKSFVAASPPRCEARLCLAVVVKLQLGLCPWFGLWPINTGPSPNGGQSPMPNSRIASEAEPRCTSGGRADVKDL